VLEKGKHFLCPIRHPSCYSYIISNYTLYKNAGFGLVNSRDIFHKFRPCIVNLQNFYVFVLCPVCPMLPVPLDCLLLVVLSVFSYVY
jgi:hypothetical protein